jgi:E3 ubiquitin-protein ligase NEDD4
MKKLPVNRCRTEVDIAVLADFDHSRNIAAGVGAEIGSHGWLRQLFKDLLQQVDSCLKEVGHVAERQQESAGGGTTSEDRPFGWAPFLVVLKGLHAVAKLYEGAMVDLLEMLRVRRVSLNVLIRQSRWQVFTYRLIEVI